MREAVGLFEDMEHMQKAIKDLEATDFPRDSLSVLGEKSELISRFGTPVVDSEYVEEAPNVPREAPVRSEEKVIGAGVLISSCAYIGAIAIALAAGAATVPTIISAAALGGALGAALGVVLTKLLADHFALSVNEQIRSGGIPLWVRTSNTAREELARQILTRNGAHHIKIHDI